jgi:hypothetical protein
MIPLHEQAYHTDHTLHCPRCGRMDLTRMDFARDSSRPNGLDGWCKQCRLLARKMRAHNQVRLLMHYRKSRSSWSPAQRKANDRLERNGVEVYIEVHGVIYRWGGWRKPAYPELGAFIVAMTERGKEIVYE